MLEKFSYGSSFELLYVTFCGIKGFYEAKRKKDMSDFLTCRCWTKCFVPQISSQRKCYIFNSPKTRRHFIFTLTFLPCKIWPIPLSRKLGKEVPRDATSRSRRTDTFGIQLKDLKHTTWKGIMKFTVVYFIIVVS